MNGGQTIKLAHPFISLFFKDEKDGKDKKTKTDELVESKSFIFKDKNCKKSEHDQGDHFLDHF